MESRISRTLFWLPQVEQVTLAKYLSSGSGSGTALTVAVATDF